MHTLMITINGLSAILRYWIFDQARTSESMCSLFLYSSTLRKLYVGLLHLQVLLRIHKYNPLTIQQEAFASWSLALSVVLANFVNRLNWQHKGSCCLESIRKYHRIH